MKDFLLEILSEEIPAKMQQDAAKNFAQIAFDTLTKAGLKIEQKHIKSLISPRRLALLIENLEEKQEIATIEKIGPKVDADQKAIEGFLKANGLKNESELEKIEKDKTLYYLFKKPQTSTNTLNIIQENLTAILQKMTNSWPKLMRYQTAKGNQAKWIRPIRNILCIFDNKIVDFEFCDLKAKDTTFGHFLYSDKAIKIRSPKKYEMTLRDNFVIVNQDERKKTIIAQINKIKYANFLETVDSIEKSTLFDEVNNLCEWPTALLGNIDEQFMDLPQDVLILTLKLNQKYFCLKEKSGKISPKFIFISNAIDAKKHSKKIIADNEKIVKARLSDAKFFIEEDLKIPLEKQVANLKNIAFHPKLDSLYEKCERIEQLAEFLSIWIPHCNISKIERTAHLCKADLPTKAVAELPELQGKIGSFYAHKQNEDEEISNAIYEHYLPLGPNSKTPQSTLGAALAIADKIDSIVGLFLANERPTSSKDPFALRRAALGIIRICFEHDIKLPIRVVVAKSLKLYKPKLIAKLLNEEESAEKLQVKKNKLGEEIIIFMFERLKNFLRENQNIRMDVIKTVIDGYIENLSIHKYGDIVYLGKKVKLYKRSASVLAIEEKNDGCKYEGKPSRLFLKTKQEKNLYKIIKKITPEFKKFVIKREFAMAFILLKSLETPLSEFFDSTIVNDKNIRLRTNRLLLLSKIRSLFNLVTDLSKVEI